MKDSSMPGDPQKPRGLDRRGFLQRAGAITAGGFAGAAALLGQPGVASPPRNGADATRAAPSLAPVGGHPGAPYFFRIESTGAAVTPAGKEV